MDTTQSFSQQKGNKAKLIAISAGHFMNDFYIAIVTPILFVFKEALSFTMAQQGFIAFALTASTTWLQPLIGFMLNKHLKTWFLTLSIVWISFWISISGLVTDYVLLVTVLVLGGIASALYHPLGNEVAIKLNTRQPGTSLSVFMMVGTLGVSIAPLVSIPIVTRYGLDKLIYFMIPGLIVAIIMYFTKIHQIDSLEKTTNKLDKWYKTIKTNTLKYIIILALISAFKRWIRISLIAYGAQLFIAKSMNSDLFTLTLFIHYFLAIFGTLAGGILSDKFGNKKIFLLSMILGTICVGLIIHLSGIAAILAFVLIGPLLAASNPINVVMAREHMPENTTFATGVVAGLGGGFGGFGALLQGYLADRMGLISSLLYMLIPMALACILITFLPASNSQSRA